ncbi:PREDICTED: polygalacturonase inhibitor-like [Nelumbo nucifera]|uniref:Polygalacturonase inhibitor-like n=2 Tax=Nelumbo nucifera TaxID=4432 RepID=A0A1U8QB57_NELNU|nr:PREDICTED: polygalacturonase inhibitor-like [Nelumbo nucifera]DAD43734.1 TPA_asm: hypothetical protein HUJ06_001964 [Nelumbo nucifera]
MVSPTKTTSSSSILIPFLLCISSFLPSLTLSFSIRCHPDDQRVLLTLKKSLNPQQFSLWNPQTDCCDWPSVACDTQTNRVRWLVLSDTTFPGSIPAAVGDLSHLDYLEFSNIKNLTGSIPYFITKLQKLQVLTITKTSLSGPIPQFLGQLKNLGSINLAFNKLTGPIPASLGDLTNLVYLKLDVNKLTGVIPESLGQLKNISGIDLSHNRLSGTIPKSLAGLKFDTLFLSHNKLIGDASTILMENDNAWAYDLSYNQLDFDLSNVRFPNRVTELDLSHNRIRGSIPKQMTELLLAKLDLSYNQLCGEIPIGGKLQQFRPNSFKNNKCLCGPPLPKCK